ncbi:MAG: GyrI-like domain-containing protein [Lachnospiraceae bacterium]|nr:GyrI-like domain-containing protein [Lachnospiraceae bacterium]
MAVKILEVKRESCPAARFIGKRYETGYGNWGEWWANDWFAVLEKMSELEINDDGYIGAMHVVEGNVEYWIGMFFPLDTAVPEGFEYVDMESMEYAVFYLYGNEQSGELYGLERHNQCLEELKKLGLQRKEDDWCFERYNCPRFTTPDELGNVILDYGISIEV